MDDDQPEAESTFHLLERARFGDQDAANRLFARYVRPLRRWASGRLPKWARDMADTDDLVQETLLQTFQVNARFTRVADSAVIWKSAFNRDAKALPAILDDISLAIVNELRVTLGQGQRRYDLDPDLYYQFLQARAFHGRRGPENSAKAAELFQQLVSSAPDYAPAWAGLASALAQLSRPSTGEKSFRSIRGLGRRL